MNIIDKIYYINLESRPDRNQHFLNQCSEHNIPSDKIYRYNAINGSTFNFSEEQYNMFKNVDYLGKPFQKKIMGNQLSHYYILCDMVKNNYEYIIILQDDVIFRNNFITYLTNVMNNIPDNAEIINIGFHKHAAYSYFVAWDFDKEERNLIKTKINDEIGILNERENPCSLAYIVTNKGAKNLIEHFKENGFLRSTDYNYNDYLINKGIFYASNTVLCTGNPSLGSDIFG